MSATACSCLRLWLGDVWQRTDNLPQAGPGPARQTPALGTLTETGCAPRPPLTAGPAGRTQEALGSGQGSLASARSRSTLGPGPPSPRPLLV